VAGSYVEFSVNAASAGTSTVAIRTANGTTVNRPMDVSVNGAVVSSGVAFGSTGNWDTWATKNLTLTLVAGVNKIRLTATTANGGPNVDYVEATPAGIPPPVTRYEAENATISQGITETLHPGYSGTAYVNCDNVAGSYVEFSVNATSAGTASVRIRYSNGTTANRPANVSANGVTVAAGQAFNPTTNWDTWADVTLSIPLNAGANTIRITATTATGPANIDYIEIS
jgi:hypothetical protein